MANLEKTIGIDLGTTYSCVAIWQHNRVEVIANDQGNRTTPSMVAFTAQERLLGEGAKHQIATNPTNTVFDVKRLIGRRFTDSCVQNDIHLWPFQVVPDTDGLPLIEVEYKGERKQFPPQEISSMILVKMKKTAEDFLNTAVRNAVITVPAYFNDAQRKATKDAATIAGLNVIRVINEPSAAAIAYGFRPEIHTTDSHTTILVFDLGGGTFDVSIVTLQSGKFEVKGVGGDMHLGGEDFDNNMLNFCVQTFSRRNRSCATDVTTNARAMRRLRTECERAKRTLSTAVETVVDIDNLHESYDFNLRITRAKFEELNTDLFQRCIQIVGDCITEAGMRKEDIDEVVLVGGSSRILKVQQLLTEYFDGKQPCKTLNPDEAVATGAALQAANLNNESVELILTDVVPLSLGVSINSGVMNAVVARNTAIPTRKEKRYTTRIDGQTEVSFPLYEGERSLVADNNLLGEFKLTGIPVAPAGVPDIRVVFSVDENGILTVTATEERSGVSSRIVICNESGRLTSEQIDLMVRNAERFKRDDELAKRRLLAKNDLESLVNNMRARLRISGVREAVGDVRRIQKTLQDAEDWMDDNVNPELGQLQRKLEDVRAVCRPLMAYHRSGTV